MEDPYRLECYNYNHIYEEYLITLSELNKNKKEIIVWFIFVCIFYKYSIINISHC